MHESEEIDRSLSTDEAIHVSPRLLANVMAEVRVIARPAPPSFPWNEFSLTLASYGGFAAVAATVFTSIDLTVFVPVARELILAGATVCGALATVQVGRHFE